MRRIASICTDGVLLVYAYMGAAALRVHQGVPAEVLETLLVWLIPFVAIHVACLAVLEGYDFTRRRSESDLGFSAVLGTLLAGALCFTVSTAYMVYYAPERQVIPRTVFLLGTGLALVALPGWRLWYTRQRRRRGELRTRVLLVGPVARTDAVGAELAEYSRSGHEVIGYVSPDDGGAKNKGYLGNLDDLPSLVEAHHVDEILVIGEGIRGDAARLLPIVELGYREDVTIYVLPGYYEMLVGKLDLYELGGLPLIRLRRDPVSMSYGYVKRALDLAAAAIGLVAASPVLAAAALAVKLDSPGPVFYRQERIGRGGRPFQIIKLRTMRQDAEKHTGPVWASKDDPRVTRVGRFLRSKRLDEIPQLWNILKGDMSLVGPRPERGHFIEQFKQDLPLFPLRLSVKPGLTSLSHVWGRYDSDPADRLRYDLVYMSNVSFTMDLRILLETVKIVLTGRGAQ